MTGILHPPIEAYDAARQIRDGHSLNQECPGKARGRLPISATRKVDGKLHLHHFAPWPAQPGCLQASERVCFT
jgi:hypothetical protein